MSHYTEKGKLSKFVAYDIYPNGSIYVVTSKDHVDLGEIEYYEPWKQYIYVSDNDRIYSADCLKDIARFLEEKNQ